VVKGWYEQLEARFPKGDFIIPEGSFQGNSQSGFVASLTWLAKTKKTPPFAKTKRRGRNREEADYNPRR
jgi:hypothetical protein